MAAPPKRFRHYSIYYRNRKVAMINAAEENITSNDEAQIGDEGYAGHSDGATMTRLNTDAIIPVGGIGVSIIPDMLRKAYIDLGLSLVDGRVHRFKARIIEASVSSSAQNGTQTGRFVFEGGVPNLT